MRFDGTEAFAVNLASWLDQAGRRTPSAPALFCGETEVASYGQFRDRAARIAGQLRGRFGIVPGDRIALFMQNSCAYLECLYGIWWSGAVAVPINAKLHRKEAAWIVGNAEAAMVFACRNNATEFGQLDVAGDLPPVVVVQTSSMEEFAGDVRSLAEPVSRSMDDLAWLFYTSGTTGRPKGVMLTNANLIAMSVSYTSDVDAVSAKDTAVYAAPISHGAGLYCLIHVRQGARHSVPEGGGFDPGEIFALAKALGRISLFAAPTMVKRLVGHAREHGLNGDGIKTVVYGGGPMYLADIEEAICALGQKFVQIYGQGETPMTITVLRRREHETTENSHDRSRLSSVGTPHSVVEIRVTDASGAVCPTDRPGEIEVRGLTVMRGYWNNEDATRQAIVDGWLKTGDVGRIDAQGFLTLTDRSKDVIISGGTNIYPREVEEILLQYPLVREAAVIGEPDPEWGENVVAFLVLDGETSSAITELESYCIDHIARFKRPKRYIVVDALPKNNYGKILKTTLRQMLGAGAAQEAKA